MVFPSARLMNQGGGDFLARAAFAGDEDGAVAVANHAQEFEHRPHARALADNHRIHREHRCGHGTPQISRSVSNSGISSRRAVSTPMYSVMCALGHPAHMPVSFTSAEFPAMSISLMSPPSARMNGRTRSSTASTRSLVIMLGEKATPVPENRCRKPVFVARFRWGAPGRCGLFPAGADSPPASAGVLRAAGRGGAGVFGFEFFMRETNLFRVRT